MEGAHGLTDSRQIVHILDQSRACALIDTLKSDGDVCVEAHGEDRLICKLDVDFGTFAAIFIDAADSDHLTGEFFAFDHGAFPSRADMTVDCMNRSYPAPVMLKERFG